MEGVDAYSFHEELNQESMNNSKSKILDTISSWLDLDDPSIIPQELQQLQDLQMLDENFFDFANTTATGTNMEYEHPYPECNILPVLPRPDSPFLLDLHEFDNNIISQPEDHYYHPVLPGQEEVILDQPVNNEAECEQYLNVMSESSPDSICVDQYFQTDSDNLITMASISPSSSVSDVPQQPRLKMQKTHNIEKPPKVSTKRHQSTTTVTAATVADDDDEEEEEIDDEPKKGTLNCKNLVSERNRRKRLSQQLLALRALVPNITKMDKRSVLVDALSYLRNMQEETAKLQKELKEQQLLKQRQPRLMNNDIIMEDEDEEDEDDLDDDTRPRINTHAGSASKTKPQIIEIDIEKMEEKRFIVKITCIGANGIAGDTFRVMETTGFEITYAAVDQIKPQHFLSTVFIRVKKQEKMTEEKLKDCIISSALRCGLSVLPAC
ncbi:hypothetical protein MKW98_025916 [Papaver atlanticum]|uniref:BHLH domain-containing protein n=1 Tax=Papaver atlanticum TaxID=357466 RepID=A0AAD4XF87_9MAGN|nr:hypothetical protein MKW98_025916 [Papaver atlanticum]